jgi:geranylgeranyl reductase family protein
MEKYDVIIVGGGPAGSSCAWHLTRHGLKTAIIDKSTFPRNKVCAGWITPEVVQTLQIDLEDYAKTNVLQPITAFVTGIIGGNYTKSDYASTVSYGIRRCEFDDYLLRRSGATTILGEKIKSLEKHDDCWQVNGQYSAPLLIGAGGHFCPVVRHMGAKLGQKEAVISAQEIEFSMSDEQLAQCNARGDTPELFFCQDLKGYGWVFRKQNYLNIGLGRQDNRKLNSHIEEFVRWLKTENRIPQDIPEKFLGHAYLLYGENNRPLLDDNVMIIGDAAGLAYAQSGEGIRPAIESALIAADTVVNAAGDYRKDNLQSYVTQLEARLGKRKLRTDNGEDSGLWDYFMPKLGRIAIANHWFAKNIVIDRWFLHRHVAALQY